MVQEPTQDPQDKAFGAAASEDQDIVDELERRGLTEEELSDEPTRIPVPVGRPSPRHPSRMRNGRNMGPKQGERNLQLARVLFPSHQGRANSLSLSRHWVVAQGAGYSCRTKPVRLP